MNHHFYGTTCVFFDPWIDLDYYYTVLPLLPLVFDRVFIYYPSDRWVETTHYLSPIGREHYRQELLYWARKGIIVPVVKGEYPFSNDIGEARLQNDGPTDQFQLNLQELRKEHEVNWVILPTGATERGRESARQIIRDLGNKELFQALRVKINPKAVPELAYYHSGGQQATAESTLTETIGTYENDDWIRSERNLGEYLLPSVKAYQYRALHDLRKQIEIYNINHYAAVAAAIDQYSQ